jgi:hypothetical protein
MMSARKILFLIVLSFCMTVPAFAQLSTGSISGTVQDVSGAVIPGVSIILTSPGVIGGNQQTITGERGTYQFTRLVPGKYSVKAELAGFKAFTHGDVGVNADVTVRVDFKLEVGTMSDEVTVTGEAALLDTTSALNQAVLDRATLDKLPTGHDLWSIGRTVPGVVVTTFDVGGNQSFQQYTPTVHGSSGTDNKYAVDGLDVAWAGGAGTVMVYFDPNMFEEINYQVGNISAENRQGGVVMNMVTKTGTNAFHGSFMFTGTNESMQSDNISPELRTNLIKQIPASVLAANPTIRPGQQIQSLFDTAASLSGPIVRDKFWFTSTYKISSLNQFVLNNYNPNGTQGIDDNRIINGTFKLSYKTTEGSQLHYTYSRNLKYRYHRRTADVQEDAASRFQDQWADIHQMKWTNTISSRMVMDAGVSLQVGPSPYLPKAEALAAAAQGLFPKTDQATGASTVMNSGYNSQPQYRIASNFNLNYFAGKHELKGGYQFSRIMLRSKNWSIVDPTKAPLPGPFSARYNNGTGNQVTLYNYPTDSKIFLQEHGFFLQDKWTVTRKLTLNFGIRFDQLSAWNPRQCQPDTAFVPGQCFEEIRNPDIPNLFSTAPRFSFIYDVFGDGRTAFKGSANVYHEGLASGYPSLVNPYGTASNAVNWGDANNDGKPQPNEIAYNFVTKTTSNGTGWSFNSNNFYDRDLKRPYSVEFSLGLQRELPGGFVASGTYFRRDSWRTMGSENIALSEASYDPITVTIPENNQKVTIYSIKSSLQTLQTCTGIGKCLKTANHSDRGSYFNGADLTLTKRMSDRWMIMAGLSLNSNRVREPYRRDNPNLNIFQGGPASNNTPVSFKMSGVYQAPLGFEVAANFQHFAGTPEQKSYTITKACSATVTFCVPALTPTSLTINLSQRGETSKPDVRMLDLSIGREFRIGEQGLRVSPKMEFFNLANASTVTSRSTTLSGTGPNAYLNPSAILSPRMLRLGMQLNF